MLITYRKFDDKLVVEDPAVVTNELLLVGRNGRVERRCGTDNPPFFAHGSLDELLGCHLSICTGLQADEEAQKVVRAFLDGLPFADGEQIITGTMPPAKIVEPLPAPSGLRKIVELVETLPTPKTVLEEAEALVNGARRGDYGHPLDNFENIAAGFAVIFKDGQFTAEKVALAMDWVKTCRLVHSPEHRDSIVDKAGYTRTYELVRAERDRRAEEAKKVPA